MSEKKISQIGATPEGVAFLRKLAGRSAESGAKRDPDIAPTAPFTEMKDAYRALFIYGLLKGERLPLKNGLNTIYANVNMLTDRYDFNILLSTFGDEEDLVDIGKSINEYTNWAIQHKRENYSADSFDIASEFYVGKSSDSITIITRRT